jgi:hypothetical protein
LGVSHRDLFEDRTTTAAGAAWSAGDPATTLYIIPCSAAKLAGCGSGDRGQGRGLAHELPAATASAFLAAREAAARDARVDESTLMPGWRRYDGHFYRAARAVLARRIADGGVRHVLITSGGYGLLLADEPIGNYSARLDLGRWPSGLLQKVLTQYARGAGIEDVRTFAPASGHDARLVRGTPWRIAGVRQGWLYTPVGAHGDGAQVKVPRAEGEAFAALLSGTLGPGWKSSDGLSLSVERLP